jgi:hypothetical protein
MATVSLARAMPLTKITPVDPDGQTVLSKILALEEERVVRILAPIKDRLTHNNEGDEKSAEPSEYARVVSYISSLRNKAHLPAAIQKKPSILKAIIAAALGSKVLSYDEDRSIYATKNGKVVVAENGIVFEPDYTDIYLKNMNSNSGAPARSPSEKDYKSMQLEDSLVMVAPIMFDDSMSGSVKHRIDGTDAEKFWIAKAFDTFNNALFSRFSSERRKIENVSWINNRYQSERFSAGKIKSSISNFYHRADEVSKDYITRERALTEKTVKKVNDAWGSPKQRPSMFKLPKMFAPAPVAPAVMVANGLNHKDSDLGIILSEGQEALGLDTITPPNEADISAQLKQQIDELNKPREQSNEILSREIYDHFVSENTNTDDLKSILSVLTEAQAQELIVQIDNEITNLRLMINMSELDNKLPLDEKLRHISSLHDKVLSLEEKTALVTDHLTPPEVQTTSIDNPDVENDNDSHIIHFRGKNVFTPGLTELANVSNEIFISPPEADEQNAQELIDIHVNYIESLKAMNSLHMDDEMLTSQQREELIATNNITISLYENMIESYAEKLPAPAPEFVQQPEPQIAPDVVETVEAVEAVETAPAPLSADERNFVFIKVADYLSTNAHKLVNQDIIILDKILDGTFMMTFEVKQEIYDRLYDEGLVSFLKKDDGTYVFGRIAKFEPADNMYNIIADNILSNPHIWQNATFENIVKKVSYFEDSFYTPYLARAVLDHMSQQGLIELDENHTIKTIAYGLKSLPSSRLGGQAPVVSVNTEPVASVEDAAVTTNVAMEESFVTTEQIETTIVAADSVAPKFPKTVQVVPEEIKADAVATEPVEKADEVIISDHVENYGLYESSPVIEDTDLLARYAIEGYPTGYVHARKDVLAKNFNVVTKEEAAVAEQEMEPWGEIEQQIADILADLKPQPALKVA